MTCIFKILYSNSNRISLICNSLMICISILQFNYNIKWLQISIIILSIINILSIFCQDQHLNLTLHQLHSQNNLANSSIDELSKQNKLANSIFKKLRKHNRIIYYNLAKELYTQFESSAVYNSIDKVFFDILINIKDPYTKLSFDLYHFNFNDDTAFDIVSTLLYNLGPEGNI